MQPKREPLADGVEPDLSVNIAGVHFENPVIGSSGTFGFGTEYKSVFDVNRLGGISSKGLRRKKCLFLIHKLKRIGVDNSFSASGCLRDDFEVFPVVDYPHDMYL